MAYQIILTQENAIWNVLTHYGIYAYLVKIALGQYILREGFEVRIENALTHAYIYALKGVRIRG